VILGSDRLYSKKRWLPLRRTPIWIAFGNPIRHFSDLEKSNARACIELELAAAFKLLYAELQEKFHTGRSSASTERTNGRMKVSTEKSGDLRTPASPGPRAGKFARFAASSLDSLMCASINLLQSRHRLRTGVTHMCV
jgi:hypothetical protein